MTYGRFEPVRQPSVLPREPFVNAGKEGESAERLVVRSDFDTPTLKGNESTERHVVPASANPEVAEIHGMFDKSDGTGLDAGCFKTIAGKTGKLSEVEPAAQLALPYLPDPLAAGATFIGLPGSERVQVSFKPNKDSWPELKPFRLRVEGVKASAAVAPPEVSEEGGARVLTVQLPQAEFVRVRLSTFLADVDPDDYDDAKKVAKTGARVLGQLGLWQWMDEWIRAHSSSQTEAEGRLHLSRLVTLAGLHWMITPYRELVLVHAVGRPLKEPASNLTASKDPLSDSKSATFARLAGQLTCDGKSTGKLDVTADWEEPRDDPREPQPRAPSTPAPEGMAGPVRGAAHVLEVPLNLPDTPFNFDTLSQLALSHGGKQLGTYNPAQGVVTLTNNDLRHEFGDTKTRLVNYSAIATTRFREYFPPSKLATDAERQKERELHARASQKQPVRVPSSALRNLVSQWGADPLHASAGTNGLLAPSHFTNALKSNPTGGDFQTTGLGLEEQPVGDAAFTVAPHAVGYDAARRLWYCDIEIDPGASYFPFVRLALARYQPNSIAGAHLSRVVQADFIQLAPGRSLAVAATTMKRRYRVTLNGITYGGFKDENGNTQAGGTSVTVAFESATRGSDENAGTRKPHEEMDWTPGETVALTRGENDDAWTGEITLPEVPSPATKLYRLVVREFETLFDSAGAPRPRLVYADVLSLN